MALRRNYSTPFCVVDLSYFLHLRCNATVKWYLQNFADELYIDTENLLDYDFVGDPEFISGFEAQFTSSLTKFINNHRCKFSKTILAKDCKRDEIWRRRIFEDYKANRDAPKRQKDANLKPLFAHVYNHLLPKLEDKFGFKLIETRFAEGDDIIAVVTEYMVEYTADDIVVMANDMDLCQIINDRINIFDYRGNSINDKCKDQYGTPKRMLYAKILQGDRSDNIPNICRGMGKVTALKCVDDKELLMEKLEKNPEAPKQLKMNKILVDFRSIPQKLKSAILRKYKEKME